jgi:hypothetical protein
MATHTDRPGTKRIVLVIDEDLHTWLQGAAHQHWSSVTGFIRDMLDEKRAEHPEWGERPSK